jgi:hypothetical protein
MNYRAFCWLGAVFCLVTTIGRADGGKDGFVSATDAPTAISPASDAQAFAPAATKPKISPDSASKHGGDTVASTRKRPTYLLNEATGEASVVVNDGVRAADSPFISGRPSAVEASDPPRRFVPVTDADELSVKSPEVHSSDNSSTPFAPSVVGDSRLTDEEISLIRRWARGVAQHEDRAIQDAGFARQDPFADDPVQPVDPPPMPPDFTMPESGDADADADPTTQPNGQSNASGQSGQTNRNARGFDPAVVAQGLSAFQASCTACHDAERSTSVRKSLGGWMATVRRMAAKDGADIAPSDVQPIATYLASLNPTAEGEAGGNGAAAAAVAESSWSLFSTVSLIHRSGTREEIENQGFFPEVWLGAEWHPAGPLSGRVNACVSCHTENASVSSRIELAEGFLRLDMMKLMGCEDPACQPFQLHVDAGRFIVPFGAFAAQSHPGAFRTATRPLMYNMGQNVYRDELPPPLLPMPYADEGVVASATLPLFAEVNATLDFYAINGLQGSTDLDLGGWYQSRDYVDNNTEPAVGGRGTIGNKYLRAGASLMSGRYNENTLQAAVAEILDYKIYGADLTARYEDWVRIQVEWARRDNDAFDFIAGEVGRESIQGTVVEGEFKLWSKPKISAIVRYDDQRRTDGPPRFGTPIVSPEVAVQRFTYGLNFALGSSTLMLNHERWKVPEPLNDLDILAIRWVAAF